MGLVLMLNLLLPSSFRTFVLPELSFWHEQFFDDNFCAMSQPLQLRFAQSHPLASFLFLDTTDHHMKPFQIYIQALFGVQLDFLSILLMYLLGTRCINCSSFRLLASSLVETDPYFTWISSLKDRLIMANFGQAKHKMNTPCLNWPFRNRT